MQRNYIVMKYFYLTMFILITSLLISGCNGLTPGPGTVVDENYRTGSEGIVTSFYSPSLKNKIYEKDPFEVSIEVANKGAYHNPLGKIVLSGYDQDIINFESSETDGTSLIMIPDIRGKSPTSKTGDIDYVIFNSPDGALLEYGDSYKTTITADTCFQYETFASPGVCIIPDPKILQGDKPCTPKNLALTNQGAPIAVTKIEEEVMKDAVNFIITIENVGKGTVISPDDKDLHSCPFFLDEQNTNLVSAEVKINGLGEPICTPKDKIRLTQGKGKFICRFITRGDVGYNTQLQIKLKYNYHNSIKHNIEIVKLQDSSS